MKLLKNRPSRKKTDSPADREVFPGLTRVERRRVRAFGDRSITEGLTVSAPSGRPRADIASVQGRHLLELLGLPQRLPTAAA